MSSTLWLCSDHHFHHANLLRGGKIGIRPFDTLEEMHETVIERHNAVVTPNDKVYFLGDVTLGRNPKVDTLEIVKRLNGRKRLLLGNHDHFTPEQYRAVGFEKIMATRTLGGCILSHIPVHPMQVGEGRRFKKNVHGHLHGANVWAFGSDSPNVTIPDHHYINVCLEQTNYAPVAFEEITSCAQ